MKYFGRNIKLIFSKTEVWFGKTFTAHEQNRFVEKFGFQKETNSKTDLLTRLLRVQIRESFSERNSLLILHSTNSAVNSSNVSQTSGNIKRRGLAQKIKHSQSGHADGNRKTQQRFFFTGEKVSTFRTPPHIKG